MICFQHNKYLEYSLVHNYKKAVQLNNEYKFFSENSFEFKNMTRRFVCLCIGYLELENVSRNQKIKFLKNEYVLGAIHLLLKLKKRELPGWTRRNHFSMILLKLKLYRLLILLHYKLKLNLIPR